jgi:hypothetical protein
MCRVKEGEAARWKARHLADPCQQVEVRASYPGLLTSGFTDSGTETSDTESAELSLDQ